MAFQPLTSSEIASLWTGYLQNSLSKCMVEYFLQKVEDTEIQPILQTAFNQADANLNAIQEIMVNEGMPVPIGFTEKDVNLQAGRLFSDTFFLMYIHQMGKTGLVQYSIQQAMSTKANIKSLFSLALKNTSDLYNQADELMLEKGLLVRSPYIPEPTKTEFIQNKDYFKGFSLFNEKRPLNAIEITHLFMNTQTNLLGSMLCIGFYQTASSKEVSDYLYRGAELAKKHIKVFSDHLINSEVQAPMTWDSQTLESTVPPFSDKLMMFHISLLVSAGIVNYAAAAAASLRRDLSAMYVKLSAEVTQFAENGADIMAENNWMEEPPQAPNRLILNNQK